VDDTITTRAREEHISAMDVANKYIDEYFKDVKELNITPADVHPRVSETMPEIIAFVQGLIDKGLAYEVDGDVYYSTRKFPRYGLLSGNFIENLEVGARIPEGEKKRDPLDFALWKAQKTPDEIAWDSPWGKGRPGWHIECSAMARKFLGDTIDIHSGGVDLCFPHHENEIAQSECCTGKPFAHYWLHNAFLNIDNQKMSKSLGNFFTVRDAAKTYGYDAIRFFMLSAHYRSPLNYSQESLMQARAALTRLNAAFNSIRFLKDNGAAGDETEDEKRSSDGFGVFRDKFCEAMDDDMNTADAVAAIFEAIREINTLASRPEVTRAYAQKADALLSELCGVLGIGPAEEKKDGDAEIEELIEKRQAARRAKDFKEADRIRDMLKEQGIILEDTAQGVRWHRA
jgi:cysteinyl-tRNA synthetase